MEDRPWTLGVGRKRVWQGDSSADFCFDGEADDPLLCSSAALGPPSRTDTQVYDLQWARLIRPQFGVQAQIFFEDEKDILNPHFKMFFIPQSEKLRGGLDLSYTEGADDSTEGFNARLFVGVPFDLKGPGS